MTKVVILAGGQGTRLAEETVTRPKPMVEIGGRPILWHIMKNYSAAGFDEFIICLGYKGHWIKEFFSNYFLHSTDVTIDFRTNETIWHHSQTEKWRVTLVDTGEGTMTGGRLARVADYLDGDTFCMTYGDAVSDLDIAAVVRFHHSHGKLATVTAVEPIGRFGNLNIENNQVKAFEEKPAKTNNWINGGFFVLSRKVIDLIDGDQCVFERRPLEELVRREELMCFQHDGFWHCMDNIRDKNMLEQLWQEQAPWKTW
ncbi:MAG: glucose-1-phosphate cytidylyltransferase [Alphaproteobacteria bacterium]|nr:glucose-1-phosphate cytidylyltransferase [Alphaproteobacteria bacterium]